MNHKIQTHAFFWYKDTSSYVLHKLANAGVSQLNMSLEDGNKNNKHIIRTAKQMISQVRYVKARPCGSDQLGFYCSFMKHNQKKKPWVLYCHDKSSNKIDWINSILDPILTNDIDEMLDNPDIGIISSSCPKYVHATQSEEDLIKIDKKTFFQFKRGIVESRHTLTWLRELQYILFKRHELVDKENLNFKFTAGNMFLIRANVLETAHSCVHSNFFPNNYRPDGDIAHALERFYYYVSICMKYKNEFIGEF